MTALLIGAGLALALALLVAIYRRTRRSRAVALGPPEDLRRRRMSWPPPSRAVLLLARAERLFCRGGRHV